MARLVRRGRVPRVAAPRAQERALGSQYEALIEQFEQFTIGYIEDRLPRLYSQAGIRLDGWVEDLVQIIDALSLFADRVFSDSEIDRIALRSARAVADITGRQAAKQLEALIGVDIFTEPYATRDIVSGYVRDNVNLIKTIRTDLLADVEGAISRTMRSGARNEDLTREIRDRFGVSKKRARVIARDQIGKLTGQLTRERHKSLGIEEYIWRTVGDERVRDRHTDLNGNIYRYDDPPVSGTGGERLNPGEPIQCRCYAEPVLPESLAG
jgi:phage putative head morphogenesis protein, SPP1 gp7 family